jgi:hypothetical protein
LPFRFIIAATAIAVLAACQDDAAKERACYDRIKADFARAAQFGRETGREEYTMTALRSGLAAAVIWSDDDRNICDYVTAGPRLERK